jgi:hypothetical protein
MQRELNLAQESLKVGPPAVVTGTTKLLGFPLEDWVLWLTLIYLTFQIIVLAPKVYHTIVDRRKKGK